MCMCACVCVCVCARACVCVIIDTGTMSEDETRQRCTLLTGLMNFKYRSHFTDFCAKYVFANPDLLPSCWHFYPSTSWCIYSSVPTLTELASLQIPCFKSAGKYGNLSMSWRQVIRLISLIDLSFESSTVIFTRSWYRWIIFTCFVVFRIIIWHVVTL